MENWKAKSIKKSRPGLKKKRLKSFTAASYSSKALPLEFVRWFDHRLGSLIRHYFMSAEARPANNTHHRRGRLLSVSALRSPVGPVGVPTDCERVPQLERPQRQR